MSILALDPAGVTGFAHTAGHRGVWLLTHPSDRHPGDRLARLRSHLLRAHDEWGFDQIAYEEASFGSHNPHVQAMHNKLAGVIELTAHQLGVELYPVNPSSLKSFACGDGRAPKAQLIRAAKTLLGIETDSDDVADAIWVLEYARQGIRPNPPKRRQSGTRAVRQKVKALFK